MTETVLEPETQKPFSSSAPPRLLGLIEGRPGASTLICLGGVHGNEPSGVQALERVLAKLRADPSGLVGTFAALTGNRRALQVGRRFLRHDLNRHWDPDDVAAVYRRQADLGDEGLEDEDAELVELDRELQRLIGGAGGPVFAVDLHTTSSEGACFVVLDDSLANRDFALQVPVTVVVGLEEELSGTVTHHINDLGVRVYGFEAGQHDDPSSVDRAEAAVWIALESSGVLLPAQRPEVVAARGLLREQMGELPHVVEVIHRHPVERADQFVMQPGFENFQPVAEDQLLATSRGVEVRSPKDGLILMPLYQQQGEDGYFLVRPLRALWLAVSKAMRRLDAQRLLPSLPGVRRHPHKEDTFIVDRQTARYLARELFHLLGYRRVGPSDERYLTMTRRHPHG